MADIVRYDTGYNERGLEVQAPVVKCGCGQEVACDCFTNTCECGQEFNFAGQALRPRDQWEENEEEY